MKVRVWLLTLPILLLGETAGHDAIARLLDPGDPRHELFDLDALLVGVAALSAAAFAWRTVSSLRGEARPLPSWRLAALPPLAFLAQEHVERFAEGHDGWLMAAEPVVLAGLAVQLTLGAAALALVRSLLRAADSLGFALARRASRPVRTRTAGGDWPFEAAAVRLAALASRHAGRAPPVAA